jgi:hypothetical protein
LRANLINSDENELRLRLLALPRLSGELCDVGELSLRFGGETMKIIDHKPTRQSASRNLFYPV